MPDENEYTQALLGGLRATLDYLIDKASDAELFVIQAYLSQMAAQAGRPEPPLEPCARAREEDEEQRRARQRQSSFEVSWPAPLHPFHRSQEQ